MDDREVDRTVPLPDGDAVVEGPDAVLGAAVGRVSAQRQKGGHAADVDDVPAAVDGHPLQRRMHTGDRAEQIDLEDVAVLLNAEIARIAGMDDPGVVDEDVDGAELGLGRIEGPAPSGGIPDVQLDGAGTAVQA